MTSTVLSERSPKRSEKTGLGVDALGTGCGIGALLAVISESFVTDPGWKAVLVYVSPIASVALTWLWTHFKVRALEWLFDVKINRLINQAMKRQKENESAGVPQEVLEKGSETIKKLKMRQFEIIEKRAEQSSL